MDTINYHYCPFCGALTGHTYGQDHRPMLHLGTRVCPECRTEYHVIRHNALRGDPELHHDKATGEER